MQHHWLKGNAMHLLDLARPEKAKPLIDRDSIETGIDGKYALIATNDGLGFCDIPKSPGQPPMLKCRSDKKMK